MEIDVITTYSTNGLDREEVQKSIEAAEEQGLRLVKTDTMCASPTEADVFQQLILYYKPGTEATNK